MTEHGNIHGVKKLLHHIAYDEWEYEYKYFFDEITFQ